MATGVLPVFFGRATRAVEFFEHAEKTYVATLCLGCITDTQDSTGTVLERRPVKVSRAALEEVLSCFLGQQSQIPPMYSAIKVGGKKLYELARSGREVERKPRSIHIFSIDLLEFDGTEAVLRIHCSKGTYVRTLCHDIGAALGCGGCMSALRRIQAGICTEARSHTMEEILACGEPETLLLPVDSLFSAYPRLTLTANQEKQCRNGASFSIGRVPGRCRAYGQNGEFLALCEVIDGKLKTVKSFFEV